MPFSKSASEEEEEEEEEAYTIVERRACFRFSVASVPHGQLL